MKTVLEGMNENERGIDLNQFYVKVPLPRFSQRRRGGKKITLEESLMIVNDRK